ncbi:MAG: HEAT repeat domain-containing protein [Planctomycetota bacterium]
MRKRERLGNGRAALVGLILLLPQFGAGSPAQESGEGGGTVEELVGELKRSTDRAEPAVVQKLSGLRTRAALDGLLEAYGLMSTTWMRREIVRALPQFDGVPDAELPALQKLMDVATQADEPELRVAAIDGLGQCRSQGKNFLALIVDSPADDSVRERAMVNHVSLATDEDRPWYIELYERKESEKDPKEKKTRKDRKKGDAEPEKKKVHSLNTIRFMAFEAVKRGMSADDLEKALGDKYPKIRAAALEQLEVLGSKNLLTLATDVFKGDGLAENRVLAAQVIARLEGAKAAPEFMKRAMNVDTPMSLRRGLAEILAGFRDPMVNRQLVNEIGKGRTHEKLFVLWAVRGIVDEKIDKAVQKLLQDKDPEVVVAACRTLAERKDATAVPALKKLVEKGKDRQIIRAALEAQAVLRTGELEWLDELILMSKDKDPEFRNLALEALGGTSDPKFLEPLVAALEDPDWSTRLAALEALEGMKSVNAITAIIARMPKEEGRMLQEFASTLWRLTGQPYQDNAEGWANWWKENGDKFVILTDAQLQRIKTGEDEWRLKQGTRIETKFFGIRIVSHKVIFIIDISGSMAESSQGEYKGRTDVPRIDIAKEELAKCISGLDPAAFFNVIIFSGDSARMVEGSLLAATEKNRNEAVEYVEKLGAFGGTNLYGALREAFADPDVDTIYVMSDGEPSVGDVVDPLMIREEVAAWNEHRGIVLNTIAIGGQFQILEWLAEDSGGTHVKFE